MGAVTLPLESVLILRRDEIEVGNCKTTVLTRYFKH